MVDATEQMIGDGPTAPKLFDPLRVYARPCPPGQTLALVQHLLAVVHLEGLDLRCSWFMSFEQLIHWKCSQAAIEGKHHLPQGDTCAYLWVHFLKQISYQFPYPSLLNDLSCLSIWPHSAIFCTALDTSSCHQDLLEQPTKHNARASWILQQNPSIAGATSCHMTVVSQQASV